MTTWHDLMAAERRSLARHETPERDSRDTAEYHAATERSGLPQSRRHRGVWLADGAPERWECDE